MPTLKPRSALNYAALAIPITAVLCAFAGLAAVQRIAYGKGGSLDIVIVAGALAFAGTFVIHFIFSYELHARTPRFRKTPRSSKNPIRVSETERTLPALVGHIRVRRVRGGIHGSTPERGGSRGLFSTSVFKMQRVPRRFHDAVRIVKCSSLKEGRKPVSDADMKVEVSTKPPTANVQANEKRGFDMPLFDLSKMAMPGIFRGIAEQSVERARENCEKMTAASGEIADVLREAYSTSAKGAAEYGGKVIEISGANTASAFDFLTNLMGTKSLSEIITLSATQSRKNFDTASAQNKELWDLARKVATETTEPMKKGVTTALQKVA
jgi:phasin